MTLSRRAFLGGVLATGLAAGCTQTGDEDAMTTTTTPATTTTTAPPIDAVRTPDSAFADVPDWPFTPRYVEVDSLRVHYIAEGPAEGPQIVLLHGMPAWSFLWRTTIPPLVDAGFRVIAPDLVGFGRSDKPTRQDDYTLANHVRWLSGTLQAIGVEGATVVLNDWGGLVGLRVAAEDRGRMLQRLVVMDTSLNNGSDDFSDQYLQGFRLWLRFWSDTPFPQLSPGAVVASQTPGLPAEAVAAYDAPFASEEYVAGLRINDRLYPLTADAPGAAENARAREELRRWPHPTCLCFSAAAERFHPGQHDMFRALLPPDRVWRDVVMAGTGHFLAEQRGRELAELISEFVTKT